MRRHRKLKILKMLIRPHPELDYLPAAGRQACTADTRPIRLCGPRAGAPGMAPTLRNSIRLGVRLPSGKSWQARCSRSCRRQPEIYGPRRAHNERRRVLMVSDA